MFPPIYVGNISIRLHLAKKLAAQCPVTCRAPAPDGQTGQLLHGAVAYSRMQAVSALAILVEEGDSAMSFWLLLGWVAKLSNTVVIIGHSGN